MDAARYSSVGGGGATVDLRDLLDVALHDARGADVRDDEKIAPVDGRYAS